MNKNKYQEDLDRRLARRGEAEEDNVYVTIDEAMDVIRRSVSKGIADSATGFLEDAMDGVASIEGQVLRSGFDAEMTEFVRGMVQKIRKWGAKGLFS